MGEATNKVLTDLVVIVSDTGHYQKLEKGVTIDLLSPEADSPHLGFILPESLFAPVMDTVKAALRNGAVRMVSCSSESGGNEALYEAKAVPVRDKYALLMVKRISDHEEKKKTQHQKHSLLQTIIDNISTRIIVFDSDGRIVLRNKASLDINTGSTKDEYLKNQAVAFKPDGDTPYEEDELPLARAFRGESVYDQIVIKKSEARPPEICYISAVPLLEEAGQASGVLLLERDVSDIEDVKRRLEAVIQEFDMFMYQISHALRSPLAAMKNILAQVEQDTIDMKAMSYLNMIKESYASLSTIVDHLVSSDQPAQKEFRKCVINLNTFVNGLIDELRSIPEADQIKIRVYAQESIIVVADEMLLRIALQNLIQNAIIHHYPGGDDRFVFVMIFERADDIVIEVTDNGPGISSGIQASIENIISGNYRDHSAPGILAAKQALEKMSGKIELSSKEGFGSTFSITVPKIEAQVK